LIRFAGTDEQRSCPSEAHAAASRARRSSLVAANPELMEKIVSLCKRRGFVYPAAEIYGGFANAWDYGPLGVQLRRNIRDAWWRAMVQERDDVVGLEATVITNPRVWIASGHVSTFNDPLVDCKNCKSRYRADHIDLAAPCPNCGMSGQFTEPRMFNMMLRTNVGAVQDDDSVAYLRPETAQGMFINFDNVLTSTRRKLPFGIAQIGRSFRNEITPGNFIFRTREFEQMEMEYFVKPGEHHAAYDYWRQERMRWFLAIGVKQEKLRYDVHPKADLAHYSAGTTDIEYEFPIGWQELEGIASRTDYDLRQHSEHSGRTLTYFDEESKQHITPYVIEPALGVDRTLLTLLCDAYDEEQVGDGDTRVVLRFHPTIAPVTVAILPLSRNEKLVPTARKVWELLRPYFITQYDDAQGIGRRYRRQDEAGTPFCVTVDFQTVEEDQAVTIRERDSMAQMRVPIADLILALRGKYDEAIAHSARTAAAYTAPLDWLNSQGG
jgi:glycyl-tRNA synthetase